jgi:predicted HTH domain antitoxin
MEEVETKEDINISITQKGDITFKEQAEEAADAVKQVETAKPKKKRKYYPKKKKVQE